MAAVTSDITPTGGRRTVEVLETIAVTNAAATTTVSRALAVPGWAKACRFVLDITIAGTTPLFDLAVRGGQTAGGRYGSALDSTTDIYDFAGAAIAITQLTTNGSTPIVSIDIGPGIVLDTTGSATANSSYAFPTVNLPPWLIYVYTYDGTDLDEDYNGTISVQWFGK